MWRNGALRSPQPWSGELPEEDSCLFEEIATGLHPAAQRNLVRFLLELSWEKHLQVSSSAQSQAVLECVPADARIFLVRHGLALRPRYGVSATVRRSAMSARQVCS